MTDHAIATHTEPQDLLNCQLLSWLSIHPIAPVSLEIVQHTYPSGETDERLEISKPDGSRHTVYGDFGVSIIIDQHGRRVLGYSTYFTSDAACDCNLIEVASADMGSKRHPGLEPTTIFRASSGTYCIPIVNSFFLWLCDQKDRARSQAYFAEVFKLLHAGACLSDAFGFEVPLIGNATV